MKEATRAVVPNVFVHQACLGNRFFAEGIWVKPLDVLLGFAPYEVWDHPELLLSGEDAQAQPNPGPLTLCVMRSRIIHAIKPHARTGAPTLSLRDVPSIGGLPFVDETESAVIPVLPMRSVRDDDPAPLPNTTLMIPGTPASVPTNGSGRFLHVNRRARRGGRAFRGR